MSRNSNFIAIAVMALIFCAGLSSELRAQSSQQKTQDLIAALSKSKYKKKEKRNISVEVYVDIKSEAVTKNNLQDYAGVYQTPNADYKIELRISPDGRISGSGYDTAFNNSQKRNFTLKDARIDGALLTAVKVFTDGGNTESFEAVFNNRIVIEGKNPNQINSRETKYGLGFIDSQGELTNKVFLEFRP